MDVNEIHFHDIGGKCGASEASFLSLVFSSILFHALVPLARYFSEGKKNITICHLFTSPGVFLQNLLRLITSREISQWLRTEEDIY